jgi:hypothetical protein
LKHQPRRGEKGQYRMGKVKDKKGRKGMRKVDNTEAGLRWKTRIVKRIRTEICRTIKCENLKKKRKRT